MEYYYADVHLRNGKTIRVRRRKYTVWGDKYNPSKGMGLIAFYHRRFIENMNEGLSVSQVAKVCPSVSYDCFRARLG